MATKRPMNNVEYTACTVDSDTLLCVLAGYLSFGLGLVAMLRTTTADASQHQNGVALAKQLSNANVAQLRARRDTPKQLAKRSIGQRPWKLFFFELNRKLRNSSRGR